MGQPSVFPHGTTIYNPEKCWNGYTIVPLINDGVLLFDINGNEVRRWNMQAMPPKLPAGRLRHGAMPATRHPDYGMQDGVNLHGDRLRRQHRVRSSTASKSIDDPGRDHRLDGAPAPRLSSARATPSGYYVPGMDAEPLVRATRSILCPPDACTAPTISDKKLLDDCYVSRWTGRATSSGSGLHHRPLRRAGLRRSGEERAVPRPQHAHLRTAAVGDYLHINCMSYLGPNKWYDQGDQRFKPDNIIFDCREANILAIIDKETRQHRMEDRP